MFTRVVGANRVFALPHSRTKRANTRFTPTNVSRTHSLAHKGVAGEPIAPGVNEGTLFTYHGHNVHYDFLTHDAADKPRQINWGCLSEVVPVGEGMPVLHKWLHGNF